MRETDGLRSGEAWRHVLPRRSYQDSSCTPEWAATVASFFISHSAKETEALLREVEPQHLEARPSFIPVVGASGSGKSSLVLAGLVPRLRRQPDWVIADPITPGSQPTLALAATMIKAGARPTVKDLRARIESAPS